MKFLKFFFVVLFPFAMSAQEKFTVYFDSDKHALDHKQSEIFSNWMIANKDSKVVAINGFADEDGTNVYNDTLSGRRVRYIHTLILKNKIQIREDFKTRSFGESHKHSKIKAENRKVVIHYILKNDLARENEILGIKNDLPQVEELLPIEEEAMNFPENATLTEKINLSKPGTKIVLKDILFHQNTFSMLPDSRPAMEELTQIMLDNPSLNIEVQGHICCINADKRNLSLDRAKQIRRVLAAGGVTPDRVQVKGFGVSRPKYKIPEENEEQAKANRRVEIMILKK